MKKISILLLASAAIVLGLLPSCKKKSTETTTPSTPPFQIGQPIAAGNLAAGSYQGYSTKA